MAATAVKKQEPAVSRPVRNSTFKEIMKDWRLYTFLILPVIYFLIFKYGPMIGNIIAFRKFVPGASPYGTEWVGLRYFNMFISDANFWRIFGNTLVLALETLLFTFPGPIILALLLNEVQRSGFKRFVQTASYLPHFISVVMLVGLIFELTAANGPINQIITLFGGDAVRFMQDPKYFHTVYVTSRVWQGLGWGTIMYLSALTNVSPDLYEAARIDGANRWQQTLHVTLPGIRPTIITLLIMNVGSMLSISYEQILLMYSPLTYETADVISTYVYRMGLMQNNFSYAAAIGLFESLIGLVLVTSANTISKKLTESSLW